MTHFEVTEEERTSGKLDDDKLKAIAKSFSEQGFAVVSGLIPKEICSELHSSMLEDVTEVRSRDTLTHHEKATGEGHLQLGPRRYGPYVYPELVANPIIENIVSGILGEGAWLGFFNGNVNCPGSGTQPLHFDRPFAWKTEAEAKAAGQSWPPPGITVSCSVALSDITEATGATEIYPGTHKEVAVTEFKKGEQPIHHPELIKKWEPSARMEIPAGGVCFRDPRMWHRGISNPSDTPRPMVGLTYHSPLAKHQRGTLVDLSAEDKKRCTENPSLKLLDDGSLGDGRLYFQDSAQEAIESTPNLHGVYRNIRYFSEPQVVNHFLDAHLLGGARVSENPNVSPYPED